MESLTGIEVFAEKFLIPFISSPMWMDIFSDIKKITQQGRFSPLKVPENIVIMPPIQNFEKLQENLCVLDCMCSTLRVCYYTSKAFKKVKSIIS